MGRQNRYKAAIFILFFAAFLGGTAVPELIRMGSGSYAGFFSMYSFQIYEQTQIHAWNLFVYIAKRRLLTVLFLWMSTYTAAGMLFHVLYALWLLVSGGMLLALFTLKNGKEGLVLLACCLLPQWILYTWVIRQEAGILFRHSGFEHEIAKQAAGPARLQKRDLIELGELLFFCALGCACEAFLGTWTLKIFLEFFS